MIVLTGNPFQFRFSFSCSFFSTTSTAEKRRTKIFKFVFRHYPRTFEHFLEYVQCDQFFFLFLSAARISVTRSAANPSAGSPSPVKTLRTISEIKKVTTPIKTTKRVNNKTNKTTILNSPSTSPAQGTFTSPIWPEGSASSTTRTPRPTGGRGSALTEPVAILLL